MIATTIISSIRVNPLDVLTLDKVMLLSNAVRFESLKSNC
ncbi:hypothetical protein VIC_000866 [Vibrio coralliilyticus ATCC BAA-450]|nr:hypothetical protein VIC_000866 [Vibrio coralliilyticus ATCC BAA-450]